MHVSGSSGCLSHGAAVLTMRTSNAFRLHFQEAEMHEPTLLLVLPSPSLPPFLSPLIFFHLYLFSLEVILSCLSSVLRNFPAGYNVPVSGKAAAQPYVTWGDPRWLLNPVLGKHCPQWVLCVSLTESCRAQDSWLTRFRTLVCPQLFHTQRASCWYKGHHQIWTLVCI